VLLPIPARENHSGTRERKEVVVARRDLDNRVLVEVAQGGRDELRLGRAGGTVKAEEAFSGLRVHINLRTASAKPVGRIRCRK
jgi:hypothetical protein